jgi:hypothetical protein
VKKEEAETNEAVQQEGEEVEVEAADKTEGLEMGGAEEADQ